MGEPAYPTKEQTELIRSGAYPLLHSDILTSDSGNVVFTADINRNGIVYFELKERLYTPDRGYDYDKVISFH